jgi:extracellular factor (EF) 3-hydroxypalmitic acid methyl ester biosynthesis protein
MSKELHSNGNTGGQRLAVLPSEIAVKTPDPTPDAVVSGLNESHVRFYVSDGAKKLALLKYFTPQSATFELNGDAATLRSSEVLGDFQIDFQGQSIYFGRAVVTNLVDSGSNTLCEVTLDETQWLGKTSSMKLWPRRDDHSLGGDFKQFLAGWHQFYKIDEQYKVALLDMHSYFTELKLWSSQLEMRIKAAPNPEQAALERAIIAELQPYAFPTFTALFEKFEMAARGVDARDLASHQALVKRLLHPLILCSPFMHRIYAKPLGYAGDYEMVNMILRDPHEGGSLYAKLLNVFILGQVPGEAHRNRITYLVQRLLEETSRMADRNQVCKIFNLGCGPAGEVQHFLRHYDVSENASFVLLDADDETLRHTGKLLEAIKSKHRRRTHITLVNKPVYKLLKTNTAKNSTGETFDFIYSAGLFDYLTDQVGRKIIELTYGQLAPGGLLLITNVDPVNPIKNIMSHIYDWHLIYRDGRQLAELAAGLPADAGIAIRAEYTSANVILEVRKPPL